MTAKIKKARNKYILELLKELKSKEEVFNLLGGSLYSGICADEINEILDELNKLDVKVYYYQYIPGRVHFQNLDKLIKEYENE